MSTELQDIVCKNICNESEITLVVGQNNYYIENEEYSISIEYSLEKSGYYTFNKGYDFSIISIFLIKNKDNSEYEVNPNQEIEKMLFNDNTLIDDWSDESDDEFDAYLETNY